MRRHTQILAGTALGLLMATAPSLAQSEPSRALLMAQADTGTEQPPLTAEEEAARLKAEAEAQAQEAAEETLPEGTVAPAEGAEAPAEESAPEQAETPVEEPAEAAAPVEEKAPAEAEAPAADTTPAAAPVDEPAASTAETGGEAVPAASAEDEPSAETLTEPAQAAAPAATATEEQPATSADTTATEGETKLPIEGEAPAATAEPAPQDAPAEGTQPATAGDTAPAEQPANQDAAADGAKTLPQDTQPAEGQAQSPAPATDSAAETTQAPLDAETGLPENAAPVLDSAKEAQPQAPASGTAASDPAQATPQAPASAATQAAPPPRSDAEAQASSARTGEIGSITATEGRRIDREEARREPRDRRDGAEVLSEIAGRVILQLGGQAFVDSDESPRLSRDARDVYYEELPRGLVRETIVRRNGSQIVTVRNRYGDVVRRSRITPDGREIVLSYLPENRWERDRDRDWRDPAEELPPLRLTIPVRDYILDSRRAERPRDYYEFLDQPPVEQVRRLYSVDEVKRSARLRDVVRRVDLDTITFETGSADVTRSEVDELDGIAEAMLQLLEENPAETFLIEGHTDAVGSDLSNLALSDARAESVAEALTVAYGIPPENLVTQGYGERYLKVDTGGASRENRRVAIRRITPLVTPVASAD